MANRENYARGFAFPNEGFVQRAIEDKFAVLGFKAEDAGDADLISVDPKTGERWVVEAKGKTKASGLDFRTGLGQLVQRMTDQNSKYAVAFPDIPQFVKQCRQVKPWVRKLLNLHWLLVGEDGAVRIYGPDDTL
ncbi:MAG: hypothetical protein ACFFCW_04510 [Candidatus Hodarchaeota archaeon]